MNLLPITKSNNSTTTTGGCGNCNLKETFLLHNVRVRGVHRRLCTSCVLRSHPSSFCPCCFSFYDTSPPPPSKRITCSNCTSFTHSHCVPSPAFPFLCPPCADPNFNFFFFQNSDKKTIDHKSATVLLCSAKIAANSMAKAVNVARTEAERRVREAAVCRKRAIDALEHVMFVAKRKEIESVVEVSASANLATNNCNKNSVFDAPNGNNNNNSSNIEDKD